MRYLTDLRAQIDVLTIAILLDPIYDSARYDVLWSLCAAVNRLTTQHGPVRARRTPSARARRRAYGTALARRRLRMRAAL